jgi:hypothetical protein
VGFEVFHVVIEQLLEFAHVDESYDLEDQLAVAGEDDLLAFFAQLLGLEDGVCGEAGADLVDGDLGDAGEFFVPVGVDSAGHCAGAVGVLELVVAFAELVQAF